MASASLGNPQSNNLYAYVQNMPTDFVDPSGLQMVPFTMTVCSRWERPEDRVCVEVVIHWMNIGNVGGDSGGDGFGDGGQASNCNTDPTNCNPACLEREVESCRKEGETKFNELFSVSGAAKAVVSDVGIRTIMGAAALGKAEFVAMVSSAVWWMAGGAALGYFLYSHTQTAVAVENACRKQIPKICGEGCKKWLPKVGRA